MAHGVVNAPTVRSVALLPAPSFIAGFHPPGDTPYGPITRGVRKSLFERKRLTRPAN
jgi:hypothetical protein